MPSLCVVPGPGNAGVDKTRRLCPPGGADSLMQRQCMKQAEQLTLSAHSVPGRCRPFQDHLTGLVYFRVLRIASCLSASHAVQTHASLYLVGVQDHFARFLRVSVYHLSFCCLPQFEPLDSASASSPGKSSAVCHRIRHSPDRAVVRVTSNLPQMKPRGSFSVHFLLDLLAAFCT